MAVLAVIAGPALLYSFSVPGYMPLIALLAAGMLAVLVGVWLLSLTAVVRARGRGQAGGSPLGFVFLPVVIALVIGLIAVAAPLRVRWSGSQPAFEKALVALGSHPERGFRQPGPGRIGSYQITTIRVIGSAVIFFEKTGALFDDAGFGYLPDGPHVDIDSYEFNPQFRHLSGAWYAWTARDPIFGSM